MINTAILIFLSLLNAINADLIATTQTGVLVPGNAYMEMRDYILNLQVIHGGYGTISGGINITINVQTSTKLIFRIKRVVETRLMYLC